MVEASIVHLALLDNRQQNRQQPTANSQGLLPTEALTVHLLLVVASGQTTLSAFTFGWWLAGNPFVCPVGSWLLGIQALTVRVLLAAGGRITPSTSTFG